MFGRVRVADEFARVPLLAGLSNSELRWVAQLSTPVELYAGSLLAQQGHPGHEFFLLLGGRVEVVRDRELIATRGPGSPLGEIALLASRPRTATLIAETPVQLRVASRPEFVGLLGEVPRLAERLYDTMARRLAA